MPNFQNGKIYSIRSHQTDKIYIGSTTQPLAVRFGGHKRMNCTSREILVFDDAYIELIELFPCASKMELNRREGEIIRELDCVNKQIAGRTHAEWREDNKESIAEQRKQYWHTHKNRLTCSCGVEYNSGDTHERNRHYGSKHHIKFVNDFYERLHSITGV